MKYPHLTEIELDRSAAEVASDSRTGPLAHRECFSRISQTVERIILAIIVLMTLLGNYLSHSLLMRDALTL